MKTRAFALLAVIVALFVLAMLGILAWYVSYTHRIKSELDQFVAAHEKSKPVAVELVVIPPPNTPKDQLLYISGSAPALGNWDAAGVPLLKSDDGKYHAKVELLSGIQYAYKITRGTWGTAEAGKTEGEMPNRTVVIDNPGAVEVAVIDWIDHGQAVPGRITLTGDTRLEKNFHSSLLANNRNVIVYLPPGYEKSQDRYPVLYMNDGQNLMDEATSYQGIEWKLDESAQRLISSGQISPVIIVGVYNSPDRTAEYTPGFVRRDPKTSRADLYARFLVEELKPFIDQKYRTKTSSDDTTIGGASMGALSAMHVAKTHRDTFGHLIALDPWLRSKETAKSLVPDLVGDAKWLKGTRSYFDMGTDPGQNYPAPDPIADAHELIQNLESAGLVQGTDFTYREIEGDKHNEPSFAARSDQVLTALYEIAPSTTQPASTQSARSE